MSVTQCVSGVGCRHIPKGVFNYWPIVTVTRAVPVCQCMSTNSMIQSRRRMARIMRRLFKLQFCSHDWHAKTSQAWYKSQLQQQPATSLFGVLSAAPDMHCATADVASQRSASLTLRGQLHHKHLHHKAVLTVQLCGQLINVRANCQEPVKCGAAAETSSNNGL